MRRTLYLSFAAILLMLGCAADASDTGTPVDPDLALLGGDTTIFDDGGEAIGYAPPSFGNERRARFMLGDGLFNRNWVTAPATPEGQDGLGPTFNARSCSGCHVSHGRGKILEGKDAFFAGLLLRLSVPGEDEHGGPKPEPTYGDQLNPDSILGVPAEGTPVVSYEEEPGEYGDGAAYSLRRPTYTIEMPAFGPLADDVLVGARFPTAMVGLGLLEAIAESTILGFAKDNGGHPNYVWDEEKQDTVLGRFGWKANQPTVEQQMYAASRNDIGITNDLYPEENCPEAQTECAAAPVSIHQPEIDAYRAESLLTHVFAHAVPARRNLDDPMAQRGDALFVEIGCASCHITKMKTGTLEDWPELSKQTIRPFTDLLLHDMGPDLADGRPDFEATGSEWRTPPLWSLGLIQKVKGKVFLLHDGRARTFEEAILWHGGEAEEAREAFRTSSKADREALVAFLSSL